MERSGRGGWGGCGDLVCTRHATSTARPVLVDPDHYEEKTLKLRFKVVGENVLLSLYHIYPPPPPLAPVSLLFSFLTLHLFLSFFVYLSRSASLFLHI